ncbi:LIM and SH3 domain protein F42H10.3-like isoform X2 [Schistocerca americana]|uniref:LIM and SH3 domain protein F42H10.3-like isoform X2 n=1 Tax=Schistocerca americana TaxID=7009 RepID=UPI001F4F20AF|nr:LIM and SH3 domain protein F42H10.3-like isoform X2 [Schistocerca americana]XP_047103006.1 LIM and SH3 domain protein F42H10.3 isoform X2 [Schistocerca piceifrons]XP_049781472.1 LIM and SH3 domain protein F42H10.3 isoform X2 [Schistocerca cancellata]XP_049845533.1 LIM and SH3 domain protein F42H10.3 isoform X2 [Schistocerca gregaria]XP_049954562.1 LIM and SH3 domain protein F42H10.3-like isoform X2 [Schistocerca serialis cubense]
MNKKCARCEKTVYPIEELKCLDKVWHKLCFKCQVCNMTLSMKTYKGFNKQPYCEAHVPKAKATTMAETPELKRIAENTKIQSNVMYHAEFEKAKGKFTPVADDPEILRIKQNSKIISNVAYHGDLEKKAAMEQKRVMSGENGDSVHESEEVTDHLDQLTSQFMSPPGRQVGSVADLDPVNDFYGSLSAADRSAANANRQSANQSHGQSMGPGRQGRVYRAMYNYDAQDSDEVSFMDGDLIINCSPIDEGWMTGLVERTGQTGMLPANYVEPVN